MSRKIRVLHIIKSLGRGGAEMLLPETLKLHDQAMYEFHYIYFLSWKDQMVQSIEDNNGKVSCFDSSNNISLMLKVGAVQSYIKAHNIDIIHSHLPWAGILARIVGRLSSVPVIYTEHNKQERYHAGTRFMNLLTMNMLSMVVAVSNDVAESIRRNKPGLKTQIRTIPNGVNTSHFDKSTTDGADVRRRLNIPPGAPVVGTIAVFRFQKRLDLWMQIAAKILERRTDAHFIIVGDGPLRKQLESKRDLLGLRERVHLPGLQTEVRPFLGAFDIYMMCSNFEGLPVAMLEAMAAGCPVISTDAGGIKEVIEQDKDGMLCEVEQWDKLSDFALALINDPDRRAAMGASGRAKVVSKFSIEQMVKDLESLYRDLVGSSAY